jgi:hypothetical protein
MMRLFHRACGEVMIAAVMLLPGTVAHRECNYNQTSPLEDGRCAKYMGLEPVAVLDPTYDKMLCYWPDSAYPHSPDKWQSVQVGRAHPVNPESWSTTSNDSGMPADVRTRLSQPPFLTCKGSETCCFDGGSGGAEDRPPHATAIAPDDGLRYNEVLFLGTHNSAINLGTRTAARPSAAVGGTFPSEAASSYQYIVMDQRLSVRDQLEQGVRVLDFEMAALPATWRCDDTASKQAVGGAGGRCAEHIRPSGRCFSDCPVSRV